MVHVKLTYRMIPGLGSEGMSAPFWAAISAIENDKNRLAPERVTTVNEHNIQGSPGTEIIPELYELGLQNIKRCLGWVLTNKEFKEKLGE